MPNNGVDPVTVAAHIITGLQEIHARELGLSDEAILTIGTVNAGNAANVIPDTAHMSGTIRTYDESTRALSNSVFLKLLPALPQLSALLQRLLTEAAVHVFTTTRTLPSAPQTI